MFYTIYKITNKLNGKIYVGKHQTEKPADNYYGSGEPIKAAIKKYGKENFTKEVLFVFDNEAAMNAKEAELVTEEFVSRKDTYNLCPGGHGGFGYINRTGLRTKGHDDDTYKKISLALKNKPKEFHNHPNKIEAVKKLHSEGKVKYNNFEGKTHTEETKQKMRTPKNQGDKNSQFASMWITNGKENRKIKKEVDIIPEGWYKGRVIKDLTRG
jgi:group I intron endonuclease